MQDIQSATKTEIVVHSSGKVEVYVDGKCVMRINHGGAISCDDPLRGFDVVYDEGR